MLHLWSKKGMFIMSSVCSEDQELRLLGYLKTHRILQEQIAEAINRNITTVNRKLHGRSQFTIEEVKKLHRTFKIPYGAFGIDTT
ncbi:MAG: transcriptional regulator [Lentilactobacillus hilgardii]